MKKYLLNYRVIALVPVMMLVSLIAVAQTRTATQDGPWSSTATWGGQSVPTAANAVVINNNVDVSVTAAAQCASVTFRSGAGSLTVNNTITLAVGGAITLENTATTSTAATLAGAGTITCASIAVGGNVTNVTANNLNNILTSTIANLSVSGNVSINGEDNGNSESRATFSLNSGTMSVAGVITLDSDAGGGTDGAATLTMDNGAATGILNVTAAAPFATAGGGTETFNFGGTGTDATVNYAANGNQTVLAAGYRNLVYSNSGTKSSAGTVTAAAKFSLQGTAIAGSAITYSSAILEYKGTTAQTTSTNEFPASSTEIDEVIIDNPAGVTLNAAKTLSGDLTLTNGYLTTTGTNILNLSAASAASTANGAFVNGPMTKNTTATTMFTFPVGNLLRGLRTIAVTPSTTNSSVWQASYISGDPRAAFGQNFSGSIQRISSCEYWDLAKNSGTANARVTLSWPSSATDCANGQYVTNVGTLVVAHFTGGSWVNEGQQVGSITGTAAGGGTIRSNTQVATFSPFTLATTSTIDNPLPVMFYDVKAFQKSSGVQIDWSNLTERDLTKYDVERSADGQSFSTLISSQVARANNNDKQSYNAYDASPLNGANYYRVKAYEIAGKIIYSKVLKVEIGGKGGAFAIYPNPVSGNQVSLALNVKQGQYTVKVLNTSGQEILNQRISHPGGSMTQTIALPSTVKPGVYNMTVIGDNYREAKMFVVQ